MDYMQTLRTSLPDNRLQPVRVSLGNRTFNEAREIFQLLTFGELHRVLEPQIIKQLTNAKRYKTYGNIWFYALPIENPSLTENNGEGLFIIDYAAEPSKRFKPISNEKDWLAYDFTKRVRFFNGRYPLQVGIYDEGRDNIFREGSDAFMEIHASLPPTTKAPISVYMEKSRVSPEKQERLNLAGRLAEEMPSMKPVITTRQLSLLEEIMRNLKR